MRQMHWLHLNVIPHSINLTTELAALRDSAGRPDRLPPHSDPDERLRGHGHSLPHHDRLRPLPAHPGTPRRHRSPRARERRSCARQATAEGKRGDVGCSDAEESR